MRSLKFQSRLAGVEVSRKIIEMKRTETLLQKPIKCGKWVRLFLKRGNTEWLVQFIEKIDNIRPQRREESINKNVDKTISNQTFYPLLF